jgi:hypothetical protein
MLQDKPKRTLIRYRQRVSAGAAWNQCSFCKTWDLFQTIHGIGLGPCMEFIQEEVASMLSQIKQKH